MARRVILAVLVAPLAAVVPLFVVALFEPLILPDLNYNAWVWFVVLMFALPIAYAATLCIGVPLFLLLRRFDLISVRNFTIVGLAVSLIPSTITWLSGPSGDDRIYPFLYILCAVAVSFAFGVIIERKPRFNAAERGGA